MFGFHFVFGYQVAVAVEDPHAIEGSVLFFLGLFP